MRTAGETSMRGSRYLLPLTTGGEHQDR